MPTLSPVRESKYVVFAAAFVAKLAGRDAGGRKLDLQPAPHREPLIRLLARLFHAAALHRLS